MAKKKFKEQNNLNIVIEILYKACNLTFGFSQPLSLFYYPRGLPRPRSPPRPSSITLTLTLTVFSVGDNIGLSNSTKQQKIYDCSVKIRNGNFFGFRLRLWESPPKKNKILIVYSSIAFKGLISTVDQILIIIWLNYSSFGLQNKDDNIHMYLSIWKKVVQSMGWLTTTYMIFTIHLPYFCTSSSEDRG